MRRDQRGAQSRRTKNQNRARDYEWIPGFHIVKFRFHQPAQNPDER